MLPIWKNVGYVVYIILYFGVTQSVEKWPASNYTSVIFKLLPIFHILLTIISTATAATGKPETTPTSSVLSYRSYRRTIFLGLVLSMLGDIALVWKEDLFLHGLVFFAVAQAIYVYSFSLRPFGSGPTAVTLGIVAVTFYLVVADGMTNEEPALRAAVAVYATLIFTMLWRAVARFQRERSVAAALAVIGAMSFVASDFMIAHDKWLGSFAHAPFWVMITYYLAQLGIGLSACEEDEVISPPSNVAQQHSLPSETGATKKRE